MPRARFLRFSAKGIYLKFQSRTTKLVRSPLNIASFILPSVARLNSLSPGINAAHRVCLTPYVHGIFFTQRHSVRCITGAFRSALIRFLSTHWIISILGIYLASRIVTTVLVLVAAQSQEQVFSIPRNPDYFTFANIWDAKWYEAVVYFGYPKILPIDGLGYVDQNSWAFLPGYPIAIKLLMLIFGLSFQKASVAISLIFGFGACVVMYLLQRTLFSHTRAMLCVVLFAFNPLSALFQLGYADAYGLFFVLLALLFLRLRRYTLLIVVLPCIAFSRPIILAFALGLIFLVFIRFLRARKGVEAFPRRDFIPLLTATGVALVLGFAWGIIAGLFAGRLDAYLATELSWRVGFQEGIPHFSVFQPWFTAFDFYASYFDIPNWVGVLVVLGLIVGVFFIIFRYIRHLGSEIFTWSAAYMVYLFAVFFPQSSIFRILLPFSPALGLLTKRKSVVAISVVVSIVLQFIWLDILWVMSPGRDIAPP